MSLAKQLPPSELPRERLLRDGENALSLQELIAILLETGTQGKSVLILAQELLLHFKGIDGLLNATIEQLTKIKGIGMAKAIKLKATFAITKRLAKEAAPIRPRLENIEDAVAIAQREIGHLKKEALLVLLLDTKNTLIHQEIISLGILSEVLVHPREVFQIAIQHGAYSIILCHNHPSGDPTPSEADITLTKTLLQCARLIGIALKDHLILGKDCYISMQTFCEPILANPS